MVCRNPGSLPTRSNRTGSTNCCHAVVADSAVVLCFRRRVSDVSGSGGAGKFHEPGQKHLLGTLAQISWHANGTGSTWGCISVLRGNDRRPSFNRWTTSAGLGHLHWTLFRGRHRARRCRSRRARGTSTKSSGRTPIMSRRIRRPNYIDPIINSNNDRFRIVFYQGVVESRVCKVSLDLKRIRNTSRRDILGDLSRIYASTPVWPASTL